MKPEGFPTLNRSSQGSLAKQVLNWDGNLATAKKAICIPSRRPTTLMRMKKNNDSSPTQGQHMVVCPFRPSQGHSEN
jgi:hypothetical protein